MAARPSRSGARRSGSCLVTSCESLPNLLRAQAVHEVCTAPGFVPSEFREDAPALGIARLDVGAHPAGKQARRALEAARDDRRAEPAAAQQRVDPVREHGFALAEVEAELSDGQFAALGD